MNYTKCIPENLKSVQIPKLQTLLSQAKQHHVYVHSECEESFSLLDLDQVSKHVPIEFCTTNSKDTEPLEEEF